VDFWTEIETLIKERIGFDPTILGKTRLQQIIEKRRQFLKLTTEDQYLERFKNSGEEFAEVVEEIVVPETWFFRDRQPFVHLKSYILSGKLRPPLRILSAPSSSGEEAYSIAITLLEAGLNREQFYIEAIDISKQAIQKAIKAIYGSNSFRGEDFIDRSKYFQPIRQSYQLRPEVRESVVFKQANLLNLGNYKDNQYDIIFCRNLLIYLEPTIIKQVVNSLTRILKPGGILYIGSAETVHLSPEEYISLQEPFAFAYQKIQTPALTQLSKKPLQAPPAPEKEKIDLHMARELANQGKLKEAIELCQVHLRQSALSAETYLLLGELYQALSLDHQAEEYFQKVLYLNPKHTQALTHLVLLKEQRGDPQQVQVLKKRLARLTKSTNNNNDYV
jgi:chemotaxis protein methyltransferase WspC